MSFWTYILRLSNGKYYTGHTDDLEFRVAQHQRGEIEGFTSRYRPVELVWAETFSSREDAFAAEQRVGGWSRAKKEALFASDWQQVSLLARPPSRRVPRHDVSTSSTSARDERLVENSHKIPAHLEPVSSQVETRRRESNRIHAPPAIVLVRPQLGENIGKAARAMLNFGLTDLRLVAPRDGWPNPDAGPAASGANAVLANARIFSTVAEAVADCAHVYATTVRKRDLVLPVVTPEQAAAEMRVAAGASAVLFGAERSGLETEEAAIAHKILTVPVNPDFRSLNLAQAVVLVAYEWSRHEGLAMPTAADPDEPRASQAQLEGLIGQLDGALADAGYYFPPDRVPATKNTIRTILTKAGWSAREVQAMRGIVGALVRPRRR